jgi:hypothetical protein
MTFELDDTINVSTAGTVFTLICLLTFKIALWRVLCIRYLATLFCSHSFNCYWNKLYWLIWLYSLFNLDVDYSYDVRTFLFFVKSTPEDRDRSVPQTYVLDLIHEWICTVVSSPCRCRYIWVLFTVPLRPLNYSLNYGGPVSSKKSFRSSAASNF